MTAVLKLCNPETELLTHLADQINAAHRDTESAIRESLLRAKDAGELLLQVKSELPHGEFAGWIQKNCNFSERMAQHYMKISRRWNEVEAKTKRVSDLSMREAIDVLSGKQESSNSESVEWYTPQSIVDSVLIVLGNIDLDPCSNSKEDPNIPAGQHFTQEDDGLSQDWEGQVFLNPPYGRSINLWVEKLVDEFKSGDITEAVALLPARTDTAWSKLLTDFPHCFIRGRLRFSESSGSGKFASVAVYLGDKVEAFAKAFGEQGDVFVKYSPQRTKLHPKDVQDGSCGQCGKSDQIVNMLGKQGKYYAVCERCESLLGVV